MVDATTRVQMIGCDLKIGGDRYRKSHSAEMDWLASQDITPEEAMRRHEAWHAKEMEHPFWQR